MNATGKQRRLILHFDVNKTIVMRDSSLGMTSVTMTICDIMANYAWGKMVTKKVAVDKEEQQWVLAHDQLTFRRPQRHQDETEEIINYKEYLDKFFPLVKKDEVPDDAEREKLNSENEIIRQNKLMNFARPGNPAAKFKNHFEKMLKSLNLPKAAKEELGITDDGQQMFQAKAGGKGDASNTEATEKNQAGEKKENGQSQSKDDEEGQDEKPAKEENKGNEEFKILMAIFGEGKYHLIPSFFRMLIYLKKAKREFSIVFRTFGEDLNNVVFEFNKFCNGEHPCYNGRGGTPLVKFDGSKGTRDLRIQENSQKSIYYRQGADVNQSKLVTGSLKRAPLEDNLNDFYSGDIEEGSVNIYSDPIEQFVAILEILKKRSTLAVQDDYGNWKKSGCAKTGSKLLLIDQADYATQQIFMADSAQEEDKINGVDVRDVVTGEILHCQKFLNKYVIKTESHRAIMEPDYFIKLIEMAESQRDQEIEKIEQGLDSEDENRRDQDQEDEWTKLQKLGNEEYLMKTVLPVLYQGMRVVDLERPASPLEYLALYLLKHQDQVKLPPKPAQAN